MRASHGLTFMANYTWSRSIDDGGTFRTGYAIPAAYSNSGSAWKQDASNGQSLPPTNRSTSSSPVFGTCPSASLFSTETL